MLLLLALYGRGSYGGGWRVAQNAHGQRVVRELHGSWTEKEKRKKRNVDKLDPGVSDFDFTGEPF